MAKFTQGREAMTLTNEQIEQILAGATEGATHYSTRNRQYFKRDGNTDNIHLWLRVNESWSVMLESKNRWLERLERLREILTLRQEVERLKAQQSEVAARAVEWGFLEGFNGALPLKESEVKSSFESASGSLDRLEHHKKHLAKLHAEQYTNQLREQGDD